MSGISHRLVRISVFPQREIVGELRAEIINSKKNDRWTTFKNEFFMEDGRTKISSSAMALEHYYCNVEVPKNDVVRKIYFLHHHVVSCINH